MKATAQRWVSLLQTCLLAAEAGPLRFVEHQSQDQWM
jgi:hypothetical protein